MTHAENRLVEESARSEFDSDGNVLKRVRRKVFDFSDEEGFGNRRIIVSVETEETADGKPIRQTRTYFETPDKTDKTRSFRKTVVIEYGEDGKAVKTKETAERNGKVI